MKDFKKLIKEAHLGNPLNEDRFKKNKDSYIRISEPNFRKDKNNPNFLSAYIKYDTGPGVGIALGKETMAGQIRRESSAEALRQMEIIGRKLEDSYDLEDLDINDLENGVVELFAVSDDFIDMDPRSELSMALLNEENEKWDKISQMEYGKPWMELSIAQKQELLSYMNRETEKQFQTDYERRRRGDYSDDREDGMTDYQRGRMDENMGEWPKELTSRYSDEYRFELEKVTPTYKDKPGRAKYRVIDIESGELKGTPVFGTPESLMAYADDLIKPQGGTQSTNLGEDINDPVLMKARAAQMKRDKIEADEKAKQASLNKKYGSTFMDKLDAELDLKAELEDLNHEREMIMIDMEEEAEPEGGPIADRYGERLNQIDMRIADIQEELDDLRMYESVNEAIDRATTVYQIATPAPQSILVGELKELFPNKEIVTEVDDADGYESVLMFDLSGRDLKTIKDNVGTVLVWKYPIGKAEIVIDGPGKIRESVNEGKYEITYEDKDDNRKYFTVKASSEKEAKSELMKAVGDEVRTLKSIESIESVDEGTCGYTPDGKPRSKPAGPDLNEDEIPSYLTSNKAFEKAVNDSVSYNDFEKRAYGILGPKYFKLTLTQHPGVLKDYYDSIRVTRPSLEEDDELNVNVDNANDNYAKAIDAESRSGAYESLQESLRKKLQERLK